MTIAVDWDGKPQIKQTNVSGSDSYRNAAGAGSRQMVPGLLVLPEGNRSMGNHKVDLFSVNILLLLIANYNYYWFPVSGSDSLPNAAGAGSRQMVPGLLVLPEGNRSMGNYTQIKGNTSYRFEKRNNKRIKVSNLRAVA